MELLQAIKERRSIRKFTDQPVPVELVNELIENSMWAPSGMNRQAWKFLVLRGKKLEEFLKFSATFEALMEEPLQKNNFNEKMRKFIHGYFKNLGGAKLVVVCLSKSAETHLSDYTNMVSAAAAIQNFLLLAHEAGLGACWMTGYAEREEALMEFLGVSGYKLAGITPLGYPDQTPPVPPRKHTDITWLD